MKRALQATVLVVASLALSAPAFASRTSATILGTTFCTSQAPPDAHCDFRFGQKHVATKLEPWVMPMFGKNLCFGDVPRATHCDAHFGMSSHMAGMHHAANTKTSAHM